MKSKLKLPITIAPMESDASPKDRNDVGKRKAVESYIRNETLGCRNCLRVDSRARISIPVAGEICQAIYSVQGVKDPGSCGH